MGKVWIGTDKAWLHRISPTAATIDFTVDINLGANSGRVNSVDSTFALNGYPDSTVFAVDEAIDGKVVLGGYFSNIGGFDRKFLAMLNKDGSVDEAFDTSQANGSYPGGTIIDVEALLNGDILVIGNFLSWGTQPQGYAYRIATVNRLGQKTGFVNNSHFGFSSNPTNSHLLSGAGYAYVYGEILGYHSQSSKGLARIHLEAMDLVFLGQAEDQYVEAGQTATFTVDVLGTTTVGYQWYKDDVAITGADSPTLLLQGLVEADAGMYHAVYTNNLDSASTRKVAVSVQFRAPGVDTNFTPGFFGSPSFTALGKSPDNGYRIAGGFGSSNGLSSYYAGISDTGAIMSSVALQNNTGTFFSNAGFKPGDFNTDGVLVGMNGTNIYRVLANGKTDDNFNASGVSFPIFTSPVIKHLDNGSIYIADKNYLVKLNADGSIDDTFNNAGAGPVGQVNGIEVSNTGKVFIYGLFTSYNGVTVSGMALLNEDGTLDTAFDPGTGFGGSQYTSPVAMAEFTTNGQLYIGGNFTTYNDVAVNFLIRVDEDGSLDTEFAPSAFGTSFSQVTGLMQLADGNLFVRGTFTTYNGSSQHRGRPICTSRSGSCGTGATDFPMEKGWCCDRRRNQFLHRIRSGRARRPGSLLRGCD